MNYLPQKLPPVENIRDLATARGILREMLKRLISMEVENIELKRRLETLTTETDIKNLRMEIIYLKQWLEHEKVNLNMPLLEQRKLLSNPNQAGNVNNKGRTLRTILFAIGAFVLLGIFLVFLALRKSFVPPGFRTPLPHKSFAQTIPQKNSDTVVPSVVVSTPVVPEKRKESGMLELSAAHPVGLARYDNRWLSVDWMDGRIFELNPADGLKFLQAFPNSFTTGISAGDNCLWSTDAFNRRCYKHDPKTFAVLASFPTPGPSPSAVYWDGASLWLADKKTRRVYKYLNLHGNGTSLIYYQLLETEPVGIWRTNDLLWALDRAKKTIRRYRVDKELKPVDTLDISGWLPEKAQPVGLALTGSEIWILTETPSFLCKRELNQAAWVESPKPREQAQDTKQRVGGTKYVIQKGNTLANLARKFYGDPLKWTIIRDANPGIKDPSRVTDGTTIIIPLEKQ